MKNLYTLLFIIFNFCLINLNAQINMGNTTTTLTSTPQLFYDDGGIATSYSNNLNLTHVFTTTVPNFKLKVIFTNFLTFSAADSLSIYKGTTANPANFLSKSYGSSVPSNQYSTNNSLTFRFKSNIHDTAIGWTSQIIPYGIASISNTTTAQSKATTFTVTGVNTQFTSAITYINLVNSAANNTITLTNYSVINDTKITVSFTTACTEDIGLYTLNIMQPSLGLQTLPNALSVTAYSLSLSPTPTSCFGLNNGSINSTVIGGSGIYSYSYFNSVAVLVSTMPNPINLLADIYTGKVTDNLGCLRTATVTVNQPTDITLTNSGNTTVCSGNTTNLSVTTSGGTAPYNYNWTPTVSLNTYTSNVVVANPTVTTNYSVSVTDSKGCNKTSSLNVNVLVAPTVNAGSNQTICSGSFITLNGTSTATNNVWTPGGLTGLTVNISPTATTVYTLTATSAAGCSATSNVLVTVVQTPTANASTSQPVCQNGTLTFVNSSIGASSYNWTGPAGFTSILQNPSITGLNLSNSGIYTLQVTSSVCADSFTLNVTVNPLPIINLNASSSNICVGQTTTLTASGALSYTWSPNSLIGSTQVINPTISTTYTVLGRDAQNCQSTNSITIIVNALTNITGTTSTPSGTVGGIVTLYKYKSFLSKFDSITTIPIGGSGGFSFLNVPAADYIIKATPTATNVQVTYGDSAISWQDAKIVNHGCINQSTQNIKLVEFANFIVGPGALSGSVSQASGFGHRLNNAFKPTTAGEPIGGITVKGGRNPGGQMLVQTTTDASGNYTLTGLPLNSGNDSYFIIIDIPGLDTNGTYHVAITGTNTAINNLNFSVDSIYINPLGSVTGIANINLNTLTKANLYPNPTNGIVSLKYELANSAFVEINIYDLVGKKVKSILKNSLKEKNTYNHIIDLDELDSGIYFMKLSINNSENIIKLIINK